MVKSTAGDYNVFMDKRISNGISLVRIGGIFWIFCYHYIRFAYPFFLGLDYTEAVKTGRAFFSAVDSAGVFDRLFLIFSHTGWSGNILFFFISGFSLWFSVLRSNGFDFKDYIGKRFTNVYLSYFIAALASYLVGVYALGIKPGAYALPGLLLGVAKIVPDAVIFNVPLWFVTVLFSLYLIFPIVPFIYKKFHVYGVLALTLFLFLVSPASKGSTYFDYLTYFLYGIAFINLLLLAIRYLEKYIRLVVVVILAISACFFFQAVYFYPHSNLNVSYTWDKTAAGLFFALLLFSGGFLLPDGNERLNAGLLFLGRGTFAVYLYHYLVKTWVITAIESVLGGVFGIGAALCFAYAVMLLLGSFYQSALDKYLVKPLRSILFKKLEFETPDKLRVEI